MSTHKRIVGTSNPEAMRKALAFFPEIIVRRTKQGDAWVIEGPEQYAKVINEAVRIFGAVTD